MPYAFEKPDGSVIVSRRPHTGFVEVASFPQRRYRKAWRMQDGALVAEPSVVTEIDAERTHAEEVDAGISDLETSVEALEVIASQSVTGVTAVVDSVAAISAGSNPLMGRFTFGKADADSGYYEVNGSSYEDAGLATYLTDNPISGFSVSDDTVTTPNWRGRYIGACGARGISSTPGTTLSSTNKSHRHTIKFSDGGGGSGRLPSYGDGVGSRSSLGSGEVTYEGSSYARPETVGLPLCIIGSGKAYAVKGDNGVDGDSAYDLWIAQGNTGTEAEFVTELEGTSAYAYWLAEGNSGSEADFVTALKGDSAYDLWLAEGNEGTLAEFITGFKGDSAYDIWIAEGNVGNEADFLQWLKGSPTGVTVGEMKTWPGLGVIPAGLLPYDGNERPFTSYPSIKKAYEDGQRWAYFTVSEDGLKFILDDLNGEERHVEAGTPGSKLDASIDASSLRFRWTRFKSWTYMGSYPTTQYNGDISMTSTSYIRTMAPPHPSKAQAVFEPRNDSLTGSGTVTRPKSVTFLMCFAY